LTVWGRLLSRVDVFADAAHDWDVRTMEAISDARFLRPWSRVFLTATYLGDGYLWSGLGLGLILFGDSADRWNVLIGVGVTIVNVALFRFLKLLFARERPEAIGEGLRSRVVDTYSFPSGHATTSFGLAWLVAVNYPHLIVQAAVYFAAATIAFSRVYVREHYLLDVVAGAILGTLVACSLLPFFRWLFF
jgi:undecaprenyl-diphosphatase